MPTEYIYSAWEDIGSNKNKKYARVCKDKPINSMSCIIEFKDSFWQAEIPKSLDIPNFNGKKHFFIKDISYFKEISEAVLWVDIEMSKYSYNVLEKPFIFKWY